MILLAVLGLALTLCTLALLATGGFLLAHRLLAGEAASDPLALAIASLLAATAQAVGIALLLGALGVLSFPLALLAQTLVVALLARTGRGSAAQAAAAEAARHLARRTWERLRQHPALSLIAAHAVGSEALRGLFRPPLAWDSLMYHLLLTATWLQHRNLRPVFGPYPINVYGFVPANGSLWFWWWMAPSHSEIYVNLASLAQWALLGLAAGGVARQLGARRGWPLAGFLVLLTPTVVRFAATQYVDIFLSAALLAAAFFALRWMERPRLAYAVLIGTGCGLACGAKLFGVPYAGTLAAAALLLAGAAAGPWRRRLAHTLAAIAAIAIFGSFFYLRNIAAGAGPLALACEGREGDASTPTSAAAPPPIAGAPAVTPTAPASTGPPSATADRGPSPAGQTGAIDTSLAAGSAAAAGASPGPLAMLRRWLPKLPRKDSVFDLWTKPGGKALVLDAFLGITRPQSVELGAGPQIAVLALALLALPFGVAAPWRRAAFLAASQILFELVFWAAVPFAANLNIFANIRYLTPAIGLALAGGIAVAEQRGMSDLWLRGIAIALACQGLLQMHSEMPRGVRLALAACDLAAVALGLSPSLRRLLRRRAALCAAATLILALAAAPILVRFRVADRDRALATEWTAHSTSAYVFAGGWKWLDQFGGDSAVDVVGAPGTYFVYPAMGPYLERQVRYVNVDAANYDNAARYPACNPRLTPTPDAWLANLAAAHTRWLLLNRYPEFDYPIESRWAAARPDLFALRYDDHTSQIYEYLPATPSR